MGLRFSDSDLYTYEATDDAVRAADGEGQVDGGDLPEGRGQQRGERAQHQGLLLEQARLRHVPGMFIEDLIYFVFLDTHAYIYWCYLISGSDTWSSL